MNLVTAATPTSKSVHALHLEPKTTLAIVNAAGQGGSGTATTVATTTITTTTTPNGSSIGLIDAVKLAVAAVAVTNAACLPVALEPASVASQSVVEPLEAAGGDSVVSAAAASDTKSPDKKLGANQGTTIDSTTTTTTSQLNDDDDNGSASKSNCPFVHLVLQQQRQQQQRKLNASRSKTTTVAITAVASKDNARATKIVEISPTKTPEADQQQQRRRPRRLSELEQCTAAAAIAATDNKNEDEHAASSRLPQEASDGDHRYAQNRRGNDPQDDSVSMVADASCANNGATTDDEPDGHNQTSGSESDHLDAETTTKTGVVSEHEPAAMGGGHSLTKRPLVGPARSGLPSKRSPPPLPTEAHEREATKSGVIISLQQLDGQRVKEPISTAPTCGQPGSATTNRVSVLRSLSSRDNTEATDAATAAEDSDMTVDSDCNQSSRVNSRQAASSEAAAATTTTTVAIVAPGSYPATASNVACEARVHVPSGASSCSKDNTTTSNLGPAMDQLDHHAGESYPMMQFLPIEQPPDGEMLRWGRRESSLMCEAFERSVSGRILAEGSATGEDSDQEQNVEDRHASQPNNTSRRARVQTLDSLTTPPPPESFDHDRHQCQHYHDPHQNHHHHHKQQQHQQPQHQQQSQQQQQQHRQQSTKLSGQTIHHHAGQQTIHHHGGQQTVTPVAGQQAPQYCTRTADNHEQVVSYHHHHHHHHHGHQAPVVASLVAPGPSDPTRPLTAYLAAAPTRQVPHEHYELAAAASDPSANQYFLVSETSGGGGSAHQGPHHASKMDVDHPPPSVPAVAVAAPASSSLAPVALHHQHHYEQHSYSSVVHHQPYSTVGQIALADCNQQLQLDYTPIDNDLDVRFCQIQYTELTEHQLAVQTLDPHHRLRPAATGGLAGQHELVGYTDTTLATVATATSTLEPQQQQDQHKTYHLLGAPDEHSIQQETGAASVVGLVQPAPTVQHHSLTATNYYQQTTSFTLYDPNHHNHHHHYHQHQYHELEGAYGNGGTSAAMLADYEQPIVSDHYDPSVALGSCLQQFEFDNENDQECDGSVSDSHDRDERRGASSSMSLDNPNEYGAGSSASHSEAGSWSMAHHHSSQMATSHQAVMYEQTPSTSTSTSSSSGVSHQRSTTRRNQPAVSGGGASTSAEKPKAGCKKETIEKLRAFLTSRMKLKASASSTSASTSSNSSNTTSATTPRKDPGKDQTSDSPKGANIEPEAGVKSQTGGYYYVDTNQPGPSQWSEPTSTSSSRRASANSATYEQMAAGSSASNCGSNSSNNNKGDHSVYGSARSTSCSSLSSNSVEQDSTTNECLTPIATTTGSVSRTTSERRRPAKERLEDGSVQMEVEAEANIETETGGHTGRVKIRNDTNGSPSKTIEETSQALVDQSKDSSDHQMDCDEDKDSTDAGPDDDRATDSRKSSGVWSSASSSCATSRSNEESELELGVQTRASKRRRMQQQRQQHNEHPKPKRRSSDPPLRGPTLTS